MQILLLVPEYVPTKLRVVTQGKSGAPFNPGESDPRSPEGLGMVPKAQAFRIMNFLKGEQMPSATLFVVSKWVQAQKGVF